MKRFTLLLTTCSFGLTKRHITATTSLNHLNGLQHTNSCSSSGANTIHNTNNNEHQFLNLDVARQHAQIVIVGAGLAGLSAAQHLLRNGFQRITILEATERYGGRINTKHFSDAYCELGAKWVDINGANNSMYALLRNCEGLDKQIKQRGGSKYIHTQGKQVPQNMVKLIDMLFRKLCRGFKLTDKVLSGDLHALDNVMCYFQSESDKLISVAYQQPEHQAMAREIFQSLFKEFSSTLGCCLEYVNIEHITSCPLQREARLIYLPTGLDNLVHTLMSYIGKEQLHTGKPVGNIQWQSLARDHLTSISCSTKSVGCLDGSLYDADHIICTLPLGVLKNFAGILFKPNLPLDKLQAINNLGYGNPVKIYLAYKRPITRWLKTNLRPLGEIPQAAAAVKTRRVWTKQIVEISQVPKSQHVLEVHVGGGYYDEIEKLPDVKLLEQITELLRKCLANKAVPYPYSLLRSEWSSSACYLGGRPYFSTSSSARDVQRLAAPLGETSPTLLFAGDATTIQGFGTIDGARASGIREAQRIVDFYDRKHFL